MDDKEVGAVIDAWLAAQNSGNFQAYAALYAQKMDGVKRVGFRTKRFDRKGWLLDRERMFKHPMNVTVTGVAIRTGTTSATVDLHQTFQQGKFSDEGPKRFVLARENGKLRIAREEMLASQLRTTGGGAASAKGVRLVIDVASARYLVIGPGNPAWEDGPSRMVQERGDVYLAMRSLRSDAEVAGWKGRTVKLYDGEGGSCDGQISSLALLAGSTPHVSELQRWDDDPDMPGGKWSELQRAEAIYDSSTSYLVGELSEPMGCTPLFSVESGAPTVFAVDKVDEPLRTRALTAYRALPAYRKIQAAWTGEYEGQGEWAKEPDMTRFSHGEHVFVSVLAKEGGDCSEWGGALWALFEEGADSGLRLVNDPEAGTYSPTSVFDSDGDGRIEIIANTFSLGERETYLAPAANGFVTASNIYFPFNDCGC